MHLALDGTKYPAELHNVALGGERRVTKTTAEVYEWLAAGRVKRKKPTLHRDGTVTGVNGVKHWWVRAPLSWSDNASSMPKLAIHPAKIAGVLTSLLRADSSLTKKINALTSMLLSRDRGRGFEGVVEEAVTSTKPPLLGYYALNDFADTPLAQIRMADATSSRDCATKLSKVVQLRDALRRSAIGVASAYVKYGASPPTCMASVLVLQGSGASSSVMYQANTWYTGDSELQYFWQHTTGVARIPGGIINSFTNVLNPVIEPEWLVCRIPPPNT